MNIQQYIDQEMSFRPLAGKLRAKTPDVQLICVIAFRFPSPCGEIKGQNVTVFVDGSCIAVIVSVPLRGN